MRGREHSAKKLTRGFGRPSSAGESECLRNSCRLSNNERSCLTAPMSFGSMSMSFSSVVSRSCSSSFSIVGCFSALANKRTIEEMPAVTPNAIARELAQRVLELPDAAIDHLAERQEPAATAIETCRLIVSTHRLARKVLPRLTTISNSARQIRPALCKSVSD